MLERLREAIAALKPDLPRARWVRPENIHLTLAFLGEVPVSRVEDIRSAMRDGLRDISPFHVSFGGTGAFPSWEDTRVVWLGVSRGGEELARCQVLLRQHLAQREFVLEERRFHPHLTLCRLRAAAGPRIESRSQSRRGGSERSCVSRVPESFLEAANRAFGGRRWDSADMEVREVDLVESRLSPQGPAYAVLHRQALSGA